MEHEKKTLSHEDQPLGRQLLRECEEMAGYALASGLKLTGSLAKTFQECSNYMKTVDSGVGDRNEFGKYIQMLSQIHGKLVDVIAPATPRSILFLGGEASKNSLWRFLGPVPLIRRMMFLAMAALIGLIGVSLSPHVDGHPDSFSLLKNSGVSLLLNQLFLLCAATIGASFAGLFQANRYIRNRTFDPLYESSYWMRFLLGILAGSMLALLIPIETYLGGENFESSSLSLQGFGKPLLALLGGFSASVVYRIASRLTTAVESIVRGDSREVVELKEQAARIRSAGQIQQARLEILSKLRKLHNNMNRDADIEDLKQELERILEEFQSEAH